MSRETLRAVTDRSEDLRALVRDSPFYRWSGMDLEDVDEGAVTLGLELTDHHLNIQGLAHGGVIATLADAAMGLSLRSALEPGRRHVSVEIGVHYLRPVTRGRVRALGRAVRIGREIAYAQADVLDATERLLARADGTYSVTRVRA